MARPTNEERIKRLEEAQNKLLEELAETKKAKEEVEGKLDAKEEAEAKVKDPMSGPGVLCEAPKVQLGESWQLRSVEVLNPTTQTEEMKPEPTPEGYATRMGPNNGLFVVKPENTKNTIPLKDAVIPNCRSKYTREYSVYGPKPMTDHEGKPWKGDFTKEPPRYHVHLCEKHSKMFGAKTDEQLKSEGKKVPV